MRRITMLSLALLMVAVSACASVSSRATGATNLTPTARPAITATPTLPPEIYAPVLLARGFGCPDDLILDGQSQVIFSDVHNGGVNRIEPDGRITTLVSGLAEPEGMVLMPDGMLIFAVQGANGQHIDQIDQLAPGSATLRVLLALANPTNLPGIDSISLDQQTGDLLVADSPNGTILRVGLDGQIKQTIARGFTRPTDAIADSSGAIYVADEYGNGVARVNTGGSVTWLAHMPDPDDLAFDLDGTLLVTVLGDNTIARLDPRTGQLLGTVATNLFEPQGLAVDQQGNLYVSEETANIVVMLRRGATSSTFTSPGLSGYACH